MTRVECPECGEAFDASEEALFLFNRFYCSVCDALLEVVEEDPLVLEVADADELDVDESDADELDIDDGWDDG